MGLRDGHVGPGRDGPVGAADRGQVGGWLAPAQAATLLNVDRRTLARWADTGLIGHMRTPAGHRRYSAADVARIRDGRGSP